METTKTQINPTAAFQIKEIKTSQKPQMGHHENARKAHRKLVNRRKRTTRDITAAYHHRWQQQQQQQKKDKVQEDQDDQSKEELLETKILALQRIVPGGETLGVDELFEETADYILALQCQIKAMKVLTNFIEGLEKQKSKFGA